ncbi:MAG: antitoxin [Actinomycetia bacterium]|nr:antitoxin [Actinomycetes bacterium]
MGMFDELKDKATEAAQEALADEAKTDAVLDQARDFANEKTGGKFEGQINQVRDLVDGQVGDKA